MQNSANTVAANWDQNNKCAFASDGYHVKEGTNWHICGEAGNPYQDAAITVRVNILSGQSGGLLFRASPVCLMNTTVICLRSIVLEIQDFSFFCGYWCSKFHSFEGLDTCPCFATKAMPQVIHLQVIAQGK